MRVLLICDDYYHPGQVIIDGVAPLKNKGFEFDIVTNGKDFKCEMLSQYKVVHISKCDQSAQDDKTSWLNCEIQKAFIDFVEAGGGLLATHSATVAGADTTVFNELIGCRFVTHPNSTPVTVQSLKKHPVTEGVEQFCEVDEHYRLDIIKDDVDVIMASHSPAQGELSKYQEDPYHNTGECICPAACVRTQGKGRVCVLTPGHNLPVWLNPQFQKVLTNAFNWLSAA
jgi:type 1 glutamine amidotransferase